MADQQLDPNAPATEHARPRRPAPRRKRRLTIAFIVGAVLGVTVGLWVMDRLGIRLTARKHAAPDTSAVKWNPRAWGEKLDRPGLPNLHRVSLMLYRGARPQAAGFEQLKALGVRTDVNLELFEHELADEQHETDLAAKAGLGYVHIRSAAWDADDENVVAFLKVMGDPLRLPVFVHCQHGADRTGLMVAMYRIVVEGWSKQEAIAEMTKGGTGWHEAWGNIVRYIERADIESIKKQAAAGPTTRPNG